MPNDFRSYNAILIVKDHENENHWSLLIIRYSLLITRNTNTRQNVIFFIEKDESFGSFWLFYKLPELTSLKPMQMYFLLFRAPKMTSFPVT